MSLLFNLSFVCRTVPDGWKIVRVASGFINDPADESCNYCSISVLHQASRLSDETPADKAMSFYFERSEKGFRGRPRESIVTVKTSIEQN